MIAQPNPAVTRQAVSSVNVVRRRDGSEVHLDEIATAAEGQEILDELDAALLVLEDKLGRDDHRDPDWRRRAEIAHKRKRRARPALQQRIAVLRRAERQAELPPPPRLRHTPAVDARRAAFVSAAEAMLDRDLFVEIWQRAAETEPSAFADRDDRPSSAGGPDASA